MTTLQATQCPSNDHYCMLLWLKMINFICTMFLWAHQIACKKYFYLLEGIGGKQ